MIKQHLPRIQRFVVARFSSAEEFGLHLTVGVALMLLMAWLFGEIAEDVMENGTITLVDLAVAHWFHAHATPAVTKVVLLFTHLHGTIGILALTLVLAGYFYYKRARYWLLGLVVTVPGGMLLNVLLKYTFQRARPSFEEPLLTLATYSFPSGHATGATLFYGVLACYLVALNRRWGTRAAVVGAAAVMVLLVGLSRIYLGVHYLSDVMAAIAFASAWLAICISGVSTLRRRRAARASQ